MTRHFLRTLCRVLIGVVLFGQIAVSAYACPGLAPGVTTSGPMASAMAVNGTEHAPALTAGRQAVDCAGMTGPLDSDYANLCAEHCRHGQQSDQAATLTVPVALLTALYVTPPAPEPVATPRAAADTTSALAAASAPLAILHCRFRI